MARFTATDWLGAGWATGGGATTGAGRLEDEPSLSLESAGAESDGSGLAAAAFFLASAAAFFRAACSAASFALAAAAAFS